MLFSFWDGGRGHFTREMTLAAEARRRGSAVGFVTSVRYADEIRRRMPDATVYVIPTRPPQVGPPPYSFPLYSHAFGHAQRQRGLGFNNVAWILETTKLEIDAIYNFRPDVMVNDYRDTIRTAAEVCGIPLVGVAETTGNANGRKLGWWVTPPPGTVLPDCRSSFNAVRSQYGLRPITDEREMFNGDINIIPSSPSLDPLVSPSPNSHYVGRICQWVPEGEDVPYLTPKMQRHVYSYVGDPTRQAYGYEQMLAEVIRREPEMGFYIAGNVERYNGTLNDRVRSGGVVLEDFLPADPLIRDSEVVLCHGGQGTVMQALVLGKPLICVGPYHSQMTSIFRPLEEAGAGIMLNHSEGEYERRPAPDLGEGVEIFGYWNTKLNADRLHTALLEVIGNPQYAARAAILGEELAALGGVAQAVDLCESLA
jgi:UDP:flavonoid glycosyltransferase YjiC (YdhE family)